MKKTLSLLVSLVVFGTGCQQQPIPSTPITAGPLVVSTPKVTEPKKTNVELKTTEEVPVVLPSRPQAMIVDNNAATTTTPDPEITASISQITTELKTLRSSLTDVIASHNKSLISISSLSNDVQVLKDSITEIKASGNSIPPSVELKLQQLETDLKKVQDNAANSVPLGFANNLLGLINPPKAEISVAPPTITPQDLPWTTGSKNVRVQVKKVSSAVYEWGSGVAAKLIVVTNPGFEGSVNLRGMMLYSEIKKGYGQPCRLRLDNGYIPGPALSLVEGRPNVYRIADDVIVKSGTKIEYDIQFVYEKTDVEHVDTVSLTVYTEDVEKLYNKTFNDGERQILDFDMIHPSPIALPEVTKTQL